MAPPSRKKSSKRVRGRSTSRRWSKVRKTDRVSLEDLPGDATAPEHELADFVLRFLREMQEQAELADDDMATHTGRVRYFTNAEAKDAGRMLSGLARLATLQERDLPVGRSDSGVRFTRRDVDLARSNEAVQGQLRRELLGTAKASDRAAVLAEAGFRLTDEQRRRAVSFKNDGKSTAESAAKLLEHVFERARTTQFAASEWIRRHRIGDGQPIRIEWSLALRSIENQRRQEHEGVSVASDRSGMLEELGLHLDEEERARAQSFAFENALRATEFLEHVFGRARTKRWIREKRISQRPRKISLTWALERGRPFRQAELLDFFLRRVLRLGKQSSAALLLEWLHHDSMDWPGYEFHRMLSGDPAMLVGELMQRNLERLDLKATEVESVTNGGTRAQKRRG